MTEHLFAELTTVADNEAVIHRGASVETYGDLPPGREVNVGGMTIHTFPQRGELLTTFATVNDLHFGEQLEANMPAELRPDPADGPYPEFMNAAAVAEITSLDPELVVIKGDLTSNGTVDEYDRFKAVYQGAFDDRLIYIQGNHESYNHLVTASQPMVERKLEGVSVALVDTSRDGRINGSLSAEQLDWLDELGERSDQPVMIFGHHQIWDPGNDIRTDDAFGLLPDDSERLFKVMANRPRLVGYFAGHTHRNKRVTVDGLPDRVFAEVASVKDFPGTWAEYRVFEGAILQVHRRISSPVALRWSEKARQMFDGLYGPYAFGHLPDRCFMISVN